MPKRIVDIDGTFKMWVESPIEAYRAETFFTKEPETVEWIKTFEQPISFYDIGANIGIYSLYCAAIHPSSIIYAFEPVPMNYKRMLENIKLNGFMNIRLMPCAVGNGTGCLKLVIADDAPIGSAEFTMAELDDLSNPGVAVFSLDDMIAYWRFDLPTYVKIDVDGYESAVINGMSITLSNKSIRTMLIELSDENKQQEIQWLSLLNYYDSHYLNRISPHSRERRQREGIRCENVIFERL